MRWAEIKDSKPKLLNYNIGDLNAAREQLYMGEYTNVIGKFHNKGVAVSNPGFDGKVRVHGHERRLAPAQDAFSQFVDTTEMESAGQGMRQFTFDVSSMLVKEYVALLEKIYVAFKLFNHE